MHSAKSYILGIILAIAYALVNCIFSLNLHGPALLFPLVVVAGLAYVFNPLCKKITLLKPFSRMELGLILIITMTSSVMVITGFPLNMLGAITALHQTDPHMEDTIPDLKLKAAFPDHVFLSAPEVQNLKKLLLKTQTELKNAEERLQKTQEQHKQQQERLNQLFDKYRQYEARTYGCAPQDIAEPRQQRDALTGEIIQLTRAINELKANPDNARQKTLDEAVRLNKKIAGLNGKLEDAMRKAATLDKRIAVLTAHPLPQELPRLEKVKKDIQAQQETLQTILQDIGNQQENIIQKQKDLSSFTTHYHNLIAPTLYHTDLLFCDQKPLTVTSWQDVKIMLNRVPWKFWLPSIMSWGTVLLFTLLIAHNLSLIFVKYWTEISPHKPEFPLAGFLQDFLQQEKDSSSLRLIFDRPAFYLGLALAFLILTPLAWYQLDTVLNWHQLLDGTALESAASALPLGFSLPLLALAFILPRSVSSSLWSTQLLLALVLTIALPLLGNVDWTDSQQENMILTHETSFSLGAAVAMAVALLWQIKSLLFCSLHPYDLIRVKRTERRSLVRASATLLFSCVALFVSLKVILELDSHIALLMVLMFLLAITVVMKLSAELGFLPSAGGLLPFMALSSAPGSPLLSPVLAAFTIPMSNPLPALLPHAGKSRYDFRIRFSAYQLAIFSTAGIIILLSACLGLAMAYSHQMPHQMKQGMLSALTFFEQLASPQPIPLASGSLLAGILALGIWLLLRRHFCWMPSAIALLLISFPFLERAWLPMLLGWLLNLLCQRHASPKLQTKLRYGAWAVLFAYVLCFLRF